MLPLIVVNFKTYATAMGQKAVDLAKAMERASNENVRMVAVVSAFDLHAVQQAAPSLEIWSQHLDPVGQGSFTGWLQPENAIERGSKGTIINHAEHKVNMEPIERVGVTECNLHRIHVNFCIECDCLIRIVHRLTQFRHALEPLDMTLIRWIKCLYKFCSVGHVSRRHLKLDVGCF